MSNCPTNPERVDILGLDFAIRFISFPEKSACGCIKHSTQTITLDSDQAPDSLRETLQHELFHGVADALGLDLHETQIRSLSRAWFSMLESNPEVTSFLYGNPKP